MSARPDAKTHPARATFGYGKNARMRRLLVYTALIYPVQAGGSLHQAPFLIDSLPLFRRVLTSSVPSLVASGTLKVGVRGLALTAVNLRSPTSTV